MAPIEIEVDLAPAHLMRWLKAELHRAGEHGFDLRASREWRIEPLDFSDGDRLDPEDELAPHVAYGTLELRAHDRTWRLMMEIEDDLGACTAPDWPPIDDDAEGPEEISLETFAETFAIDGMAAAVMLEATDPDARRRAEQMIGRILADTHGG